jgi:hypothetical protein
MESIKQLINEKVIIRSDRAGVFFGTLAEAEPCGDKYTVQLTQCRRLWYWSGAASLSQMATEGVKKPNQCKFSMTVDSITIMGAIEILPCTEYAIANLSNVPTWRIL